MNALIYAGDGSSPACVKALVASLPRSVPNLRVATCSWQQLRRDWQETTHLLVMPGGRDLPYLRLLARIAPHIRSFVQQGGRFLGSCAGAYFAAHDIDFARGERFAVAGTRPLRLYSGRAYGPIGPRPFSYADASQAQAAQLRDANGEAFVAYTHGGCAFEERRASRASRAAVVARYATSQEVASVRRTFGRGRVLLWGVHPEIDADAAHRLRANADVVAELRRGAHTRRRLWAQSLRWLIHS